MIQAFKSAITMAFVDRYLEKYPDKEFNNKQFYVLMDMVQEAVHDGLVKSADELNPKAWKCSSDLMVLMHNTARDTSGIKRIINETISALPSGEEKKEVVRNLNIISSRVKNLENELDKYYVAVREKEAQQTGPILTREVFDKIWEAGISWKVEQITISDFSEDPIPTEKNPGKEMYAKQYFK